MATSTPKILIREKYQYKKSNAVAFQDADSGENTN